MFSGQQSVKGGGGTGQAGAGARAGECGAGRGVVSGDREAVGRSKLKGIDAGGQFIACRKPVLVEAKLSRHALSGIANLLGAID